MWANGGARVSRLCKKAERLTFIVTGRREGLVRLVELRAPGLYAMTVCQISIRSIAPARTHVVYKGALPEARPEHPWVLARQARPALGRMLEAENAALQREYLFGRSVVEKVSKYFVRFLIDTPVAAARRRSVFMCSGI